MTAMPAPSSWDPPRLRARGLVTARIAAVSHPADPVTLVAELDPRAVARVRQEALALRARRAAPVTIELRYVDDPAAAEMLAGLGDLAARGITVCALPLRPPAATSAPGPPLAAPERTAAATSTAQAGSAPSPDPFGLDPEYRAWWLPFLRFFFEHYWRVDTRGIEHVPVDGPALIAGNHCGAVPADAFMLGVALELRHPARRSLRVLYDRFVDELPWIGEAYRRLGGVPASFANAETLLRRGEVVALFPEGIAGVEKRWTERHALRPFKTGAARLALRTGAPIVPVAMVGPADAYPVVTCLYRTGRLIGLPWIPVTPVFPLCGIAGALPLPVKWHMRFLPPIPPPPPDGRPEEERVRDLTLQVRLALAAALQDLSLGR
jgi:1-acyl-sn-glycerol-3-phosphate acyltransferase